MKIYIITLFCLFTFNCMSQNELMQKYNLMPWPKSIAENQSKFIVSNDLTISVQSEDKGRVHNAAVKFLRRLSNRTGVFFDKGFPVKDVSASIIISFDKVSNLSIETKESYNLSVTQDKITIHAATDIGALRGLQSLLQLSSQDDSIYYFPGVIITDSPRFVWRGLMIDVARHFQPINVIKRNLDAMASVKMNVFHWHLTDDQGFRVESNTYPKLHELASDGLYYSQEQIKDIVAYADRLGIRVIPEFDVPGHASAILTAYPELGSKDNYDYNIERFSGVFDPTLDPTKEETYVFLENLFSEFAPLFPDEYFHIGGDENEGKHWDESKRIQQFKKEHDLDTNHDLQTYFNIRLEKILNNLDKKLMGWDEIMTPNMPTTAVIHSWRGENEGLSKGGSLISAAKSGYNTVLSNGYYIDRMFSVEQHYNIDPIGEAKLTDEERKRILGAEATMWSELVTPLTIDSRIWPRTAAIAERFWSQQEINDTDGMKHRLKEVSFRLEELGITHIKNRDVILRSMTNNQDINPLITLSKICEPLKLYSRNEGGTEYKTFSPFTLFADACVVDAKDAIYLKDIIPDFINTKSIEHRESIINYLDNWIESFSSFEKLNKNPVLNQLFGHYKNLALLAEILKKNMNEDISGDELTKAKELLEKLNTPFVDVEIVIVPELSNLLSHLNV